MSAHRPATGPSGSSAVADSITIGSPEFEADLQQLADAAGAVSAAADAVSSDFDGIRNQFALVMTVWLGPAGSAFADFATDLVQSIEAMVALLHDIATRLGTAHDNYAQAESDNTTSLDNVRTLMSSSRTAPTSDGSDGPSADRNPQPAVALTARTAPAPAPAVSVVTPAAVHVDARS